MPTRAVASKFKVELANFGVRFCNQKGLKGQLGSKQLEEPVHFAAVGKTSDGHSHEQDVYLFIAFQAALPLHRRIEVQSNIQLDVTSAIKECRQSHAHISLLTVNRKRTPRMRNSKL